MKTNIYSRKENRAFPQRTPVAHPCLAILCLTERVNLRHYIICVLLNVPQRGENRSGFPSNRSKSQATSCRDLRELKQFKARLKTALFKKRTRFVAHLRPERVNAARMIRRAPKSAPQRAEPSTHGNKFYRLKTYFVKTNIYSRKENRAFPQRTPVFRSAPLFGNPLPYGKGEFAALYNSRALKCAAKRGKPLGFPLESQ